MKKILIIGAGIGQYFLVQKAQEMGLYVIVVSPKGDYPAIKIANELFECDIYDRDSIVGYAKNNNIDAVTSDQNDLMMPTVAYVAEKLRLPGNTYEQVCSYCNKEKFRNICDEINNPVPKQIVVESGLFPEYFDVPFPWIVKPVDSQSSIGISTINKKEDYPNAVDNALSKSRCKKVIVEQFFSGREYVCEGFVYKGKYYNLSFGDRIYFKNTVAPIPSQTIFPSSLDINIQNRIIQCEQKFTQKVNPSFGIIHSEYLVNEQGEFCIVESAIRGGGVYISSHLIPLSTGCDINTLLLKCALGQPLIIDDIFKALVHKISAYICFTLPCGRITKIEGIESLKQLKNVVFADIRGISEGDITEPMITKGMRKGPIIVSANTDKEFLEVISQIHKVLKITVMTSNGYKNIIWE